MTLESGFQFLAAALAAVAVLAFPQPGAAQAYSDSFEGTTINSWWTQQGALSFGLSAAQKHTGSRSLEAVATNDGIGPFTLVHVFSEPVRGDFSVWVYDDGEFAGGDPLLAKSFNQTLFFTSSTGDVVQMYRDRNRYYAETGTGQCNLVPLAASPEWRRLRATVRDTDIVFQVENGSGTLATCTLPYSLPLTKVQLGVEGELLGTREPYERFYFDDFSYTPPGGGYTVSLLYDPLKAAKSGSTIPIKLQLLSGGVNVSSPSLVVHAVAVIKVDNSVSSEVTDSGSANPDFDFRYDAALGGYIFNLKTTGLTTGTYHLKFTVNGLGDYTAPFDVR